MALHGVTRHSSRGSACGPRRPQTPSGNRVLPPPGLDGEGHLSPARGVHTGLSRSPQTRWLVRPGATDRRSCMGKPEKDPITTVPDVFMGGSRLEQCRTPRYPGEVRCLQSREGR